MIRPALASLPPARSGAAPRPAPTAAIAATALGVLTFLGYLPGIGRSLDFDSAETVGLFVRPGPPWAAFRRQVVFNNHPMFSFLEQLVRVTTGRTDAAAMRVLPIIFGALTVGVLTWFAARRHGLVAGVAAGLVLASNPSFSTLSRSVRGYSLLTLCAVVSTVIVAQDDGHRSRWSDVGYALVAGVGLATHLYMLPVIAAHVGAVVARRSLDQRWRVRFLGAAILAALAYAGMADAMVAAARSHPRVFQPRLPWRVATMATGGGWALALIAPLVVVGAVLVLRRRPVRGAAAALVATLVVLWAVLQSSALTERFFVWLVPGTAYLVAVAVERIPVGAAVVGAWMALVAVAVVPGYTADPTAYRVAARVVHRAHLSGARSCVVSVGVAPMLAYLDSPRDFAAVYDPSQLDRCDVVVVAAWWHSQRAWFANDNRVIAAAERSFPNRVVLRRGDPALVLSRRPLPGAGGSPVDVLPGQDRNYLRSS